MATDYQAFRDAISFDLLVGKVQRTSAQGIIVHALANSSADARQASEWTQRFLTDLKAGVGAREARRGAILSEIPDLWEGIIPLTHQLYI